MEPTKPSLPPLYREAVNLALQRALALPSRPCSIILFGGLARGEVYSGWTDLDFLVILDSLDAFSYRALGEIQAELPRRFNLRIDLVPYTRFEIESPPGMVSPLASMVLAALSGHEGTGLLLHGDFFPPTPSQSGERLAAWHYATDSIYRIRKHLVGAYRTEDPKQTLERLIRWLASTIRTLLRAQGKHLLPYEPSLAVLSEFYPGLDTSLASDAFSLRCRWPQVAEAEARHHLLRLVVFVEQLALEVASGAPLIFQ